MDATVSSLLPRRVDGELEDGRLTISLGDPSATLYVTRPETPPLGIHDRAATLSVRGDDLTLDIELAGGDVEMLVDALIGASDTDSADADPGGERA